MTKKQIVERLETIMDPDINIDIWTMGLIYDINIVDDKSVKIQMTLTSPFCPSGDYLREKVVENMKEIGFKNTSVIITFDPPWTPPTGLRAVLGI